MSCESVSRARTIQLDVFVSAQAPSDVEPAEFPSTCSQFFDAAEAWMGRREDWQKLGEKGLSSARSSLEKYVPDSFTHGSAAQRKRWFMTGYQQGSVQACNTFAPGVQL